MGESQNGGESKTRIPPKEEVTLSPVAVADGVPRRSKRLAKRQERTRSYRTRLDNIFEHNVRRVMERTKLKLRPNPQHILDKINDVAQEDQTN